MASESNAVFIDKSVAEGSIWVIHLNRPEKRNAVDFATAGALASAFTSFDNDSLAKVAILYGTGGNFCAGADLAAMENPSLRNQLIPVPNSAEQPNGACLDSSGPMGVTRMILSKPVIAAVSGYAVAGGLELACWCDLRVVDDTAVFGVFCRRFGVPLIDGGTIRLPMLLGHSRAMDLILTGRPVDAHEAMAIGLANRFAKSCSSHSTVPEVLKEAILLANQISNFPQACMRSDRLSAIKSSGMPIRLALEQEFQWGSPVVQQEGLKGAHQFSIGVGRHGSSTAFPIAKL
jgi:enoyl-CoA hydratase